MLGGLKRACAHCRQRKCKCIVDVGQTQCRNCLHLKRPCVFDEKPKLASNQPKDKIEEQPSSIYAMTMSVANIFLQMHNPRNLASNVAPRTSARVNMKLIEYFFEHYYPSFPMFQRAIFSSKLKPLNTHPSVLLHAMYCLSSLSISKQPNLANEYGVDEQVVRKFQEATESLLTSELNQPSIPLVQALLLYTVFMLSLGKLMDAWLWSGCLTRAITILNLYCESDNVDLDVYEVDTARRTFWCFFIHDRMISLPTNRPLTIQENLCQAAFPMPDFIWYPNYGDVSVGNIKSLTLRNWRLRMASLQPGSVHPFAGFPTIIILSNVLGKLSEVSQQFKTYELDALHFGEFHGDQLISAYSDWKKVHDDVTVLSMTFEPIDDVFTRFVSNPISPLSHMDGYRLLIESLHVLAKLMFLYPTIFVIRFPLKIYPWAINSDDAFPTTTTSTTSSSDVPPDKRREIWKMVQRLGSVADILVTSPNGNKSLHSPYVYSGFFAATVVLADFYLYETTLKTRRGRNESETGIEVGNVLCLIRVFLKVIREKAFLWPSRAFQSDLLASVLKKHGVPIDSENMSTFEPDSINDQNGSGIFYETVSKDEFREFSNIQSGPLKNDPTLCDIDMDELLEDVLHWN